MSFFLNSTFFTTNNSFLLRQLVGSEADYFCWPRKPLLITDRTQVDFRIIYDHFNNNVSSSYALIIQNDATVWLIWISFELDFSKQNKTNESPGNK